MLADLQESGADSLLYQLRFEGENEVVKKLVVHLFRADERFESLVRADRRRGDLDFSDGCTAAQQERPGRKQTRAATGQPLSVMLRAVSVRYFPGALVMSVGVHHGIEPSQLALMRVLGVAPFLISAISPSVVVAHAALERTDGWLTGPR